MPTNPSNNLSDALRLYNGIGVRRTDSEALAGTRCDLTEPVVCQATDGRVSPRCAATCQLSLSLSLSTGSGSGSASSAAPADHSPCTLARSAAYYLDDGGGGGDDAVCILIAVVNIRAAHYVGSPCD